MRRFWAGCILLSTALSSAAATLGRYSGAGVIGRPLDIRVQVLMAPGEDVSSLCVGADVFYGDVRVSDSAVRTTVQRTSPDAEPSVRVLSSIAVDEPIVTVYVRAGCTTPFTRRYVLLADPLSEPAIPAPATSAQPQRQTGLPATTAAPLVSPAEALSLPAAAKAIQRAPSSSRAAAAESRQAAVRAQSSAEESRQSAPASRTRAASVVRRAAPVVATAPRLELDAIDLNLSIDRDPVLKLSPTLLGEPTASQEARDAAVLLWKSINASPEDILRDSRKLEALETEVRKLRDEEASYKARFTELNASLERSRSVNWLVYVLGALLLLALGGLLFLWRQHRQSRNSEAAKSWWASEGAVRPDGEVEPAQTADTGHIDIDFNLEQPSSMIDLGSLSASHELDDSTPPTADRENDIAVADADKREFASSLMASRSVAAEELFDVQQQADFFVSLGEDEQAIQVLRHHLEESQVPSASAYLDLFKIYHRLGRESDYEKLREEFNRKFNAGAPPFAQYSDQSLGLEGYETAFGRIQALWPQPRVLDVIEQSIFREPNDSDAKVFDLEAYRELLLLHAIAKDIVQRDATAADAPKDFQSTKVQPLKATGKVVPKTGEGEGTSPAGGLNTMPMDHLPPASSSLGLDVDLDELAEVSAFESSLPEASLPVEPTAKPALPSGAGRQGMDSNLIDFELQDFSPQSENPSHHKPTDKG